MGEMAKMVGHLYFRSINSTAMHENVVNALSMQADWLKKIAEDGALDGGVNLEELHFCADAIKAEADRISAMTGGG